MTYLVQAAYRNTLHTDTLAALDGVEALHRIGATMSADSVGLTVDEWQRVRGCFEQAYAALAFARTLREPIR